MHRDLWPEHVLEISIILRREINVTLLGRVLFFPDQYSINIVQLNPDKFLSNPSLQFSIQSQFIRHSTKCSVDNVKTTEML